MKRTHLSFYYLIGYLIPSGLAFLFAPQIALKLLFSNGDYGDVLPRLVGMFLLALGVLVFQIVRYQLEVLYTTILAVRGGMLVILVGLFLYSHDPFFISLLVVVGFGFILTSVCYGLDRQGQITAQQRAS
jgi:uncharacterized protein YjeT (DUF2065 family)